MQNHSSHQGSCQCGRVTFEVKGPITRSMKCNCSICKRIGALWHGTDENGLKVLSGDTELSVLQFNTMTAKHYFCRHCGVHPFSRPRLDPSKWVVNIRCIDEIDADTLPTGIFDGKNWEQAAQDFLAQMASKKRHS